MVQVVELAVVVGARGAARVQVGAAEELALNGAGTPASLKTVGLKGSVELVIRAVSQ